MLDYEKVYCLINASVMDDLKEIKKENAGIGQVILFLWKEKHHIQTLTRSNFLLVQTQAFSLLYLLFVSYESFKSQTLNTDEYKTNKIEDVNHLVILL